MSNLKCNRCGLVSWQHQEVCPRCKNPLNGSNTFANKSVSAFDDRRNNSKQKLVIFFILIIVLVAAGYWLGRFYANTRSPSAGQYQRTSEQVMLDDPKSFIPSSGTIADVMVLSGTDRFNSLSKRVEEAVRTNRDWFDNYVREVGVPLPYHHNLGLSEEEYAEYKKLATTLKLKKVGEASLSITSTGSTSVSISVNSGLPNFTDIRVDLANHSVKTPAGVYSIQETVSASAKQTPTGPWDGFIWRPAGSSNDLSSKVKSYGFSLGKFQDSNKGIMTYQGEVKTQDNFGAAFNYVLVYELR